MREKRGKFVWGEAWLLPFYCGWVIVCRARLKSAPISKGGCERCERCERGRGPAPKSGQAGDQTVDVDVDTVTE